MVSGLVTSPCDQLRIFSGDARLIRIASKSAIVFCISNGLERNKGSSAFPALGKQYPVPSCQYSVPKVLCPAKIRERSSRETFLIKTWCYPVPRTRHPLESSTLGTGY